jgi:hypothetical protein
MKPVEFLTQTYVLGAPKEWDHDTQPCGALPVRVERTEATARNDVVTAVSHWKPSADELEMLRRGACVRLSVVCAMHPPVFVDVAFTDVLP